MDEIAASRSRWRRPEPPFVSIDIAGESADLRVFADACRRAGAGEQGLTLRSTGGEIHVYRSDRGLQVVLLDPPGLLVCGDNADLDAVAQAAERCAERSRRSPYHVHLELHDWYGTTSVKLGDLTVHAPFDDA